MFLENEMDVLLQEFFFSRSNILSPICQNCTAVGGAMV